MSIILFYKKIGFVASIYDKYEFYFLKNISFTCLEKLLLKSALKSTVKAISIKLIGLYYSYFERKYLS